MDHNNPKHMAGEWSGGQWHLFSTERTCQS